MLYHLSMPLSSQIRQAINTIDQAEADLRLRLANPPAPISQIARDAGIHAESIYGWIGRRRNFSAVKLLRLSEAVEKNSRAASKSA